MVMLTFVAYLVVYLLLLAAYIGVLKFMAQHPSKMVSAGIAQGA
jgi:cytochrome d ubiquinol oxidase subunit I